MNERFHSERKEQFMLRNAFAGSDIEYRYSVLPDFSFTYQKKDLFVSASEPIITDRITIFNHEGEKLMVSIAKNVIAASKIVPSEITHLIIFTCTGLTNPGFENSIINACNLSNQIETHNIYFAGCHGAFKAMKLANSISASSSSKSNVLVCGLELCTLHFMQGRSGDQIRANTIFADGCAGFMISSRKPENDSYQINNHGQIIAPTPTPLMSWNIGPTAFFMTLSSKVDNEISKIDLDEFIRHISLQFKGTVICHPGGKSILNEVKKQLEYKYNSALESSYEVLNKYGNMSSVSILYVLQKEVLKRTPSIFALGLGPGITIEGIQLQLC